MQASRKYAGGAGTHTPAKKQQRAVVTRRQLTDAAREVFARRGFELASVEDIAAAAGKTRGAFYANFEDKEDVFFAIFEEDHLRYREEVNWNLDADSSPEQRLEALVIYLREKIRDRARMQLALEFKQYAIRHPRKTKRLADLHAAMCMRCMEADLDKLPPVIAASSPKERRNQTAQIAAILDGLALNCMFDEGSIGEARVADLIRANLRVVFGMEC
jgi:AcrR family transcriptional regulator